MTLFSKNTFKTPKDYIAALEEPRKSQIKQLDALIRKTVPGLKPFMMSGMLAYGPYHYVYDSGREGDWSIIALSSRAHYISLYTCAVDGKTYIAESYKKKLPKATIGKSCIRFKKLEDIDLDIIKEILIKSEKWAEKSNNKIPS